MPEPSATQRVGLHILVCPRAECRHVVSATEARWLVPLIAAHIAYAHWPEHLRPVVQEAA